MKEYYMKERKFSIKIINGYYQTNFLYIRVVIKMESLYLCLFA